MKIIKGNRRSGKTTFLIEYCYQNNCICLVPNEQIKEFTIHKSKEINMPIEVATMKDLEKKDGNNQYRNNVVIDELEWFLSCMLPNTANVDLVTCNSGVIKLSYFYQRNK